MENVKKCSICSQSKPVSSFRKWSLHCLECRNTKQREKRRLLNNSYTKRYEKTPKGFLMRVYRNMTSRVGGIQKKKYHLYEGLEILPRKEFYEWAWDNPEFWRLYTRWTKEGYDQRLTPSINRIDSNKGYVLGNVEWVTHSVNSSLGGSSHKRKQAASLLEVFQHVN